MSAADTPRAFPSSAIDDDFAGMSLLEHYAGQALAGQTAKWGLPIGVDRQARAQSCWAMADAMMLERAKRMAR